MTLVVVLALAIPLALGLLLLAALRLDDARAAERWALAWFSGAAVLSTLIALLGRAGAALTRGTVVGTCVVAAAIMAVMAVARRAAARSGTAVAPKPPFRWWPLLLILIVLRVAWVVADARIVPQHMTDAVENWLLRAKVIATLQRVPTDPADPFYLAGGRVSYPLGMPMLAAWPALLNGAWDERLANVAWPACFVALLALAGGGVARRASAATGWIVAYGLSSLPLFSIHAVRGGYADLLLAGHLLAAGLLANDAIQSRRSGAGCLAVVNGLFCVLLKREGLIFLSLGMAAVLFVAWRSRRHVLGCVLVMAAAVGLAAMSDLSYVRTEVSGIGWQSGVFRAFRQRLFTWDTWGLLWWVAVPLWPWAMMRLWRARKRLLVVFAVGMIAFTAAVFLLTANAAFAINGCTFDRSMMQITPLVVVAAAIGLRRRTSHGCPTPSGGGGRIAGRAHSLI